jgi:hypothetical protein
VAARFGAVGEQLDIGRGAGPRRCGLILWCEVPDDLDDDDGLYNVDLPDHEAVVLTHCIALMENLNENGRDRVLRYLLDRYVPVPRGDARG